VSALVAVGLAVTLVGSFGVNALAGDSAAAKIPDYYGWLEKYQNPAQTRQAEPAAADVAGVELEHRPRPTASQSATGDSDIALQPLNGDAGVSSESLGPGEGLSCYYHRAYYSHLPLFKDGAYTLHGSLSVAEPYHQR
jgi:hypothetical protein